MPKRRATFVFYPADGICAGVACYLRSLYPLGEARERQARLSSAIRRQASAGRDVEGLHKAML